jgi:hypothetical protein
MRGEIRSENDDIIWREDIQIKLSFVIIYHEISWNASFFRNLRTVLRTYVQNAWWKAYWCVGGAWNMSKGWGSRMGVAFYVLQNSLELFRAAQRCSEMNSKVWSAFVGVWMVATSIWSVVWCVLGAWASQWTYHHVFQQGGVFVVGWFHLEGGMLMIGGVVGLSV